MRSRWCTALISWRRRWCAAARLADRWHRVVVMSIVMGWQPLRAQPPLIELAPADGELVDGFTNITGFRELRDGRVLLADEKEVRLSVVDFGSERVSQLGRRGAGPGEYRGLRGVVALAGDSTLAEDVGNARWLLLDGARIVEAMNYAALRNRRLPMLRGADKVGRVLVVEAVTYGRSPGQQSFDTDAFAESLLVALEHRATGGREVVARLRGRFGGIVNVMKPVVSGGAPVRWIIGQPLGVEEQTLLYSDGWIAVVRIDPYRVEWRRPDGQWIRGAPLPFEHVPVDAMQRNAAVERYLRGAGFKASEMPPWPAELPPFANEALFAAPGGRLVIRRMADARIRGVRYDVVDRAGRLVGRLALGERQQIVGIGARSVYVSTRDDDDMWWVTRHPWR